VPAGLAHDGGNTGHGKAMVLGTYALEKGKPVATLAKKRDKKASQIT
jgi:hypothetical protein